MRRKRLGFTAWQRKNGFSPQAYPSIPVKTEIQKTQDFTNDGKFYNGIIKLTEKKRACSFIYPDITVFENDTPVYKGKKHNYPEKRKNCPKKVLDLL